MIHETPNDKRVLHVEFPGDNAELQSYELMMMIDFDL